jgi:hypothetical protein
MGALHTKRRLVTADFDLSSSIHNDFDGALAAVPVAGDVGSALERLGGNGRAPRVP